MVNLQASVITGLFTTFHQFETIHENFNIFTSSPFCYTSVMKWNIINPVTFISMKDMGRIMKTKFQVKLQVLWFSLQLHQEGAFSTQRFLGIFKVPVFFRKCLEKTLKELTTKLLNQWIGENLNTKYFYAFYVNVLREIRKDLRKMPMFEVCFSNITIWLSEPDFTTNVFWNMLPPFFRESYFTKHLQGTACKELVTV